MNKFRSLFILLALMLTLMSISFAAPDYRGNMVYRDGVVGSVVWHAGIVVAPYTADGKMIVQASGYGTSVSRTTYQQFKDIGNFKGVYQNTKTTPYGRECVASMAETLTYYNIPYTAAAMMVIKNEYQMTNIYPQDIKYIRCDGVVEYCNDYYGYNIQAGDISTAAGFHSYQGGMPQTQAGYLSVISGYIQY